MSQHFLTKRIFPVIYFFIFLMGLNFPIFAESTADNSSPSNWTFSREVHLRTSYNFVGNTVDLDSKKNDDKTSYLGYAYDFTLDLRHIQGAEFYAFIERRGRADYDAPLTGDRSIHSLFGRYHWYNQGDMTPRLREYWLEVPLTTTQDLNFKTGLYPYGREIGNRIALGGKYENYGITASGIAESFDWNIHWEKEDLNNRIHLGKVIDFDKVNRFNDTSAYFYAGDVNFKLGKQNLQFYCGWLQDWTPEGSRTSQFSTSVKKEDLITPGGYLNFNLGDFTLNFEGARNLGKALAVNDAQQDIEHKGYLMVADAKYNVGNFKPKAKFIVASGNKFDEKNFNEVTLSSNENNAFSVFSPLNSNLTDSHYQKQFGPYVAMAGGYAVNFGVSRPGTFGDPFVFENLLATTFGFDYTPVEKVYIGIDFWLLRAKESAYGLDVNGRVKEFSKDLGQEVDLFVSYQLTKNVKLSILGGYFMPGDYYTEVRTDTAATNIFAPTPRRDGKADEAYQLELGMDITF